MRLGPRLELKQSQRLVMTPQLQQALKVLQMPAADVAAFIADEGGDVRRRLHRRRSLSQPAAFN